MSMAWFARARSGYMAANESVCSGPMLVGSCIPASTTITCGYLVRMRSIMVCRFARELAGGIPRNPSLAPSSMTKMSMGCRRIQSSRRRPPAVVSPLTLALITRNP